MIGGRRRAWSLHWPLCTLLLLAGCAHGRPTTAPARAIRPSAAVRLLQARIDASLRAPALSSGTWGILIKSLRNDEELFALNPRKLLMPASNLKIVTLAAAADALGWGYTYETRVLGLGAIDFGFLDGDLIVSGTGDPSLSEDDGTAQAAFRTWADRLKVAGVQSLSGRIVGDDNAFDDEPFGSGWMWDDLGQAYSAGIGALQLNRDAARLTITPGAAPGDPAGLDISTDAAGLTLRNRVVTVAAAEPTRIRTRRSVGSTVLEVSGSIGLGAAAMERWVAVENPTVYFISELRKALLSAGIDVRGPAVDIDALDPPLRVQDAVPLVTHRSPALGALAETLMKHSQNQYAETLVKTIGAQTGEATFEAGRRAIEERLQRWGIRSSDALLADGSGLSRYNLITPGALVAVLSHVWNDPCLRDPFEAALPVAGRAGTLADRLKNTPAAGLVRAKTGSMTNVRSIAGYMETADGEPVVFSLIANNYGIPGADIDRAMDAILLQVAAFKR